MSFWSTLFGGPSSQEQQIAGNERSLAGAFQGAFSNQLAGQTNVLNNLGQQLTPIASLGPNQQGYNSAVLSAMNAAAINNAGAAARNAQMATGAVLAGRGGGGASGLTSGIEEQIRGSEASAAANQLAAAENQIVQNNYATGRENFWQSTAGEQNLARAYNPAEYGNLASSANQEAFKDASQIQKEKGSVLGTIGKIAGAVAGPALGFLTGGLSNLGGAGTSLGENVGNFFSGGFGNIGGGQGLGTPGPSGSNSAGQDQLEY
jgi:hypothetical protein